MRFAALTLTALLAFASPALSQTTCNIADQNLEAELSKVEGIRGGEFGAVRRDMRELRSAAMVLQTYGKTEACQAVVSAMTDLLRQPKATLEQRSKQSTNQSSKTDNTQSTQTASNNNTQTATDATNTTGSDNMTTGTTGGIMSMEERRKAASAFFSNEMPMSASDLIGSDVYGPDDNSIGEIEDIIVAKGTKPSFALISYGGFLGLGENRAAVPLERLRISQDNYVFADMTAEQLQKAPGIPRGSRDWWTDSDWMAKNQAYYQ
jgi:hypothetical protein